MNRQLYLVNVNVFIESPSVDVRYSVGNLLGIVVLGYVLGSMLSAAVTQTTIL